MIKFLEGRDAELQASHQAGLLDFIASALTASHSSKLEACQVTIYLLRLLRVVLATPANKCHFLVQNLLPPIIPMLATALENYIKMVASSNIPGPTNVVSSKTSTGNLESISEIVDGFLWTVAAIIDHASCNEYQIQMQDGLIELVISYQIIHRLRDLFALYDRPQVEGSPFPPSILLSINLLTVLTSKFRESSSIDWDSFPHDVMQGNKLGETKLSVSTDLGLSSCESCVVGGSVMPTTGSSHIDFPEVQMGKLQDEYPNIQENVLPSNFEEVATGVLKVLNNLALIDISFIQKMLAQLDPKMEFFHLMSFILSHCTSNWGAANDKIGTLLLESMSLLGYFALFHPKNQAVLRWGKSPTILHKVCDLPFVFFSDPELMPVLAGTLVAASFGCEQNKAVILQELSMDMLLPSLKSCKSMKDSNSLLADDIGDSNQMGSERKAQADAPQRSNRSSLKGACVLSQRGGIGTGNIRNLEARNHRESKVVKLIEEMHMGVQSVSEASTLMLHCRYPVSFIDKAEQFFAAEVYTSTSDLI